ncbi:MAG: dephospho-CoA kinase [Dehalococcoidia bacterium]|tara:strand:- start:5 stop:607 length:603 start_codon:yes stop_codon:yes gene_type:complete
MLVIGLTGGIASGKTTVSEQLDGLGAQIINADLVGHQVYLPGTDAYKDIIDTWGEDLADPDTKEIIRQKLGGIVFSDPEHLKTLNSITWPRIYDMVDQILDDHRSNDVKVAVLEAAILIEADWTALVDEVWVTAVPVDVASARLQKRNNLTEEQALLRISSQISNEERAATADVVIDTTPSLEQVEATVLDVWAERTKNA